QDRSLITSPNPSRLRFLTRLASLVAARGDDQLLARALRLLAGAGSPNSAWVDAVLEGLGQGRQNSRHTLASLWAAPNSPARAALESVRPLFTRAAATARDERATPADKVVATRLLAYAAPPDALAALKQLLDTRVPLEVQLAAIRSLSRQDH